MAQPIAVGTAAEVRRHLGEGIRERERALPRERSGPNVREVPERQLGRLVRITQTRQRHGVEQEDRAPESPRQHGYAPGLAPVAGQATVRAAASACKQDLRASFGPGFNQERWTMFRSFPRTRESRSCPGSGSPLQLMLLRSPDERSDIRVYLERSPC